MDSIITWFLLQFLQQASERDGLRLKLRMSNSVSLGPGSAGSSPSEKNEDSEIMNVEEFLNLPSNDDFVTMEESKQVCTMYMVLVRPTSPSPILCRYLNFQR